MKKAQSVACLPHTLDLISVSSTHVKELDLVFTSQQNEFQASLSLKQNQNKTPQGEWAL